MTDRIVVACSAGVDPAGAVEQFGVDHEVVALVVDVGGRSREVDAVRGRARAAGAVDAVVVDAKTEYAEQYVVAAVRANAGEPGRPLVPALRLPLVADHLVRTARHFGAVAVAHVTIAPDDVALAATVAGFDPDLEVLPVPVTVVPTVGAEQDLWGRLVTEPDLDDPWALVDPSDWSRTRDAAGATTAAEAATGAGAATAAGAATGAPDPDDVTVTFEHGVPVALDGQRFTVLRLLQELDALAGRHGVGRHDLVDDLVDGRKVRRVAETPGATALVAAHRDLERLTLERDVLRFKQGIDREWTDLVHDGRWASGLRRGLDAFIEQTQRHVSGDVRLRLHGGTAAVTGRRSGQSLYDFELAATHADDPVSLMTAWARPPRTAARRDRAN
ncbi:argininosuccinate synthase domain-containing protein [Curtobacterium caseinilyticum]|uniref:argininosuccinate synthase n=1 Tax=Curtobacterium caseinilyticum TaxID=3055137 RepID=A0ABT7TUA0_9MICO|nr:argininosuccinate synthase domain-containing protein [Curtobacterium caseinilyticum]MDM7893100.1 argininosuccinate synthase [Curtobacterium caseinilyticum]